MSKQGPIVPETKNLLHARDGEFDGQVLGPYGRQTPGPCPMNQGAAAIRATASSVVQTALAIKRKLIKAAK